jgi:aryl-alcohol dehydrogenase-like predicted oxidoreductase
MQFRILGRTGLRVSAIAFGAGPVSGLMIGDDLDRQQAAFHRAVSLGINWFDTAPGYGQGKSESALGRCLDAYGKSDEVHVATKVRIHDDDFADLAGAVRRSVENSLTRLNRSSVTLLQLHNGLTGTHAAEPDSVTATDVLKTDGILSAFHAVQAAGLVRFIGLTGTGTPEAMRTVIHSGEFDTIQTPYNLLNPSAGQEMSDCLGETNYGNIMSDCAAAEMGVFAIRVFAGGALLRFPPSAHTLRTKYFPLALYERDLARADKLQQHLQLPDAALRFALGHPNIHSAIIGLGSADEVESAVNMAS